jgi:putative ABC transport system permease protein
MLRTQFVYAFRTISRNKSWFIINVIGFSLAFALTFLIFSWATFEFSYDNFYKNRDRIFRVIEKQNFQGQDEHYLAQIPEYFSNTFEKEIPEIEASSCFLRTGNLRIDLNNEIIEIENVLFADNKVFDIFTFGFTAGNSTNALTEPLTAVLTQSIARRLFGSDEAALGKMLVLENKKTYTVKGVIQDIPLNSHLRFNILISLEERKPGWNYNNGNHNASGYVLLKPNVDVKSLNTKLKTYIKTWLPRNADFVSLQLQPLKDIHLNSAFTMWEINWNKFDRRYIDAIIIFAFLILFIVISNYINLTLAYSTKRNIEVGLKKIAGSDRQTLVMQFFIETSLVLAVSIFFALLIFDNAVPFLQNVVLQSYNFQYSSSSLQFYTAALFVILLVELAGVYPSLIFTSYSPASVLKNNFTLKIKGYTLRSTLTIMQFVITILLIISLLTIVKQVDFLKTKDLGYNTERVITLSANSYIKDHYNDIKEDLLKNPSILDVTFSNTRLTASTWRNSIDYEGRQTDKRWETPYMAVDFNFFDFYKMTIVQGRGFSPDLALDKQGTAYIINESLAKKLDYENPVGKKIRNAETKWGEIVGVVKDFNYSSLHDAIEPILFYPSKIYLNEISIKISGSNIPSTLKFLETKWAVYNPNRQFSYSFLDKTIEQLYTKEEDARRLIIIFSIISLFISVLGLFGMVSFIVKRRIKEIGIRKINGAKVADILLMLNRDFLKWVVIAYMIACPAGWYLMHKWLQNFAYRTDLSWWIFSVTGVIVFGIAFITVSWQSLSAATRNPVEALRYE